MQKFRNIKSKIMWTQKTEVTDCVFSSIATDMLSHLYVRFQYKHHMPGKSVDVSFVADSGP